MRCRTCEYSLWTVTGRTCPECGSAFKPSEFTFVPGTVRFECPHCHEGYIGTTPEGHLLPRAFVCPSCNNAIEMDEMVLRPMPGMEAASESISNNAWLHRGKGSTFVAWIRSWWNLLIRPSRFAATLRPQGETGPAWLFAAIGWGMVALLSLALWVAFDAMAPGGLFGPANAGQGLLELVGAHLVVLASVAALTLVAGLLLHLGAILCIPNRGPLGASMQATLYASGVLSLATIPGSVLVCCVCPCTPAFAIVWYIPATLLMTRLHRTTTGRGMMATAVPLVVFVIVGAIAVYWGITTASAAVNTAVTAAMTPPNLPASATPYDVTTVVSRLRFEPANNGGWFANVVAVAEGNNQMWPDMRAMITEDSTKPVVLGGIRLDTLAVGDQGSESLEQTLRKRVPRRASFRLGSLIVYARQPGFYDPYGWLAVWREKDGGYVVVTEFAAYRMNDVAFATFLAAELNRLSTVGLSMPHPNEVADISDAADANPAQAEPFVTATPDPEPPMQPVSGSLESPSNPEPVPPAPEESGEEEESAGDQLGAKPDPDPR
jgi:predicted RNA-binding Zn-ribbon protein involved in translation (DUF1610 family)